jgi:hypothetical protein
MERLFIVKASLAIQRGDSPLYRECGILGRVQGLEWGGDWERFPDEPHFQLKTGLTLAQMRERVARGEPAV